jgi:hypothetical protein
MLLGRRPPLEHPALTIGILGLTCMTTASKLDGALNACNVVERCFSVGFRCLWEYWEDNECGLSTSGDDSDWAYNRGVWRRGRGPGFAFTCIHDAEGMYLEFLPPAPKNFAYSRPARTLQWRSSSKFYDAMNGCWYFLLLHSNRTD